MNRIIVSFVLAASLFVSAGLSRAQEETSIGLILDCSASMWNRLDDGRYRIDAAKEVLIDYLSRASQEEGLHIGLRIYGSKVHFSKEGACLDTELVVPIEGFRRDEMIAAVREARAIGATPLALSLESAAQDFVRPGARRLVVFTDGEESCGGDAAAALEALRAAGVEVDVRIIGIGLPEAAAERFEAMGVPVENVNTAGALASALAAAAEEVSPAPPAPAKHEVVVRLVKDGAPLAGQTVEFFSSLGGEEVALEQAGEGVFRGEASPGSYRAAVSPAERVFEALAVSVEGASEFVLDLSVAPEVTISATPAEVLGGTAVQVEFSGAAGIEGEWIGFLPEDAEGERPLFWTDSNGGSSGSLEIAAPIATGTYRLGFFTRYKGEELLAGRSEPVLVTAPEITLEVPAEVETASSFEIGWTGPEVSGSWIAIVAAEADDGDYLSYRAWLSPGTPVHFEAPSSSGSYEARFHIEGSAEVFARKGFAVVEGSLGIEAPDEAMAGSIVPITWRAPKSDSNFITIVPADAGQGDWGEYGYTSGADNPLLLMAPRGVEQAEIRIFNKVDAVTIASRPLKLLPARATLEAPESVRPGEAFEVKWIGPYGTGDFVTIVPVEAEEDAYRSYFYADRERTEDDGPDSLTAPEESGSYEVRYVAGGQVLERRPIRVE